MSEPLRTCVGCGAVAPRHALARLRLGDGDRVVLDERMTGGRGAWLHAGEACLAQALKRKAFARAFRRGDLRWDGDALRRGLTAAGGKD